MPIRVTGVARRVAPHGPGGVRGWGEVAEVGVWCVGCGVWV